MKNTDNLPIIAFETQQDWEAWLEEHHTNTKSIWLKLAKKDTGIASVSYAEALEGALETVYKDAKPTRNLGGILERRQSKERRRS